MPRIIKVKTQSQFDGLLKKNELVVLQFTASYCGPCRNIQPLIERTAEEYKCIQFLQVAVNEVLSVVSEYGITAMPTFVFIHNSKELNRVEGADIPRLMASINELKARNPSAVPGESSNDISIASILPKAVVDKAPKNVDLINDNVMFDQAELLNVSGANTDMIKNLTNLTSQDTTAIQSDADSQLMLYLPFQNKVKLHTIFIKSSRNAVKYKDDEDTQEVSRVKVWPNTIGPISFEDAASGSIKPMHDEIISEKLNDGWIQLALRYVNFQNVSSILIFLDGSDEDSYTILEKIILMGTLGESKKQAKIENADYD